MATANKLFISDERMLALITLAIEKGYARNESDYLEKIGFPRTNISSVRSGTLGFTKVHILNACQLTGVSANWIFGMDNNIWRKAGKTSLELLKEAVVAVEQDLKKKVSATVPATNAKKATKKISS